MCLVLNHRDVAQLMQYHSGFQHESMRTDGREGAIVQAPGWFQSLILVSITKGLLRNQSDMYGMPHIKTLMYGNIIVLNNYARVAR